MAQVGVERPIDRCDDASTDDVGVWAATAATLGFLIVQVIEVWRSGPVKNLGDLALIEMETRRVFSADPPLTGAYSRYGWRHPGAVLFWVWAPVYRLLGDSARALSTAAALLAAFSFWWLVRRYSPNAAFSAALGIGGLLTIATLGGGGAANAWNVNATTVPVMVVLAGCSLTLAASDPLVPAITTTTWWLFVFETHAGTGVVLAPAVAVMLLVVVARRIWRPWQPEKRRSVIVASVLLVLVAAPVLLDAAFHHGGNLRRLLMWSATNDEPATGWRTAATIVGRATSLSFLAEPVQPHFLFEVTIRGGVLPGAALVSGAAAFVIAARRRDALAVATLSVLGVTWLAAVAAIASIPTPVYFWLVGWLQPLGWMTWAIIVWVLVESIPSVRRPGAHELSSVRRAAAVALAAAGGVCAALASGAPTTPTNRSETQVTTLARAVETEMASQTVLVVGADTFDAEVIAAGLLNELDRRGVTACAGRRWEYKVSSRWGCRPGHPDSRRPRWELLVRAEDRASAPPNMRLVAESDYLSPEDRRRVDFARRRVLDYLAAEGRSDLNGMVGNELTAHIGADPNLQIDDPEVLDALETLIWAADFGAQRYALYAAG